MGPKLLMSLTLRYSPRYGICNHFGPEMIFMLTFTYSQISHSINNWCDILITLDHALDSSIKSIVGTVVWIDTVSMLVGQRPDECFIWCVEMSGWSDDGCGSYGLRKVHRSHRDHLKVIYTVELDTFARPAAGLRSLMDSKICATRAIRVQETLPSPFRVQIEMYCKPLMRQKTLNGQSVIQVYFLIHWTTSKGSWIFSF